MADRDRNIRASLQALRDFGSKAKDVGTTDLASGLGNNFANEMSQGILGFTGTGKGHGTHAVAPLGEALYFGNLMADYSQAAGALAGDAILGLTALGYAAEGIATQYGDGDELSSATMDSVADAFVPLPGDPQTETQKAAQADSPAETDRAGQKADVDPPTGDERPTKPGGGPAVPDADSDEYKTPPGQI
jgi:hypothetical protein